MRRKIQESQPGVQSSRSSPGNRYDTRGILQSVRAALSVSTTRQSKQCHRCHMSVSASHQHQTLYQCAHQPSCSTCHVAHPSCSRLIISSGELPVAGQQGAGAGKQAAHCHREQTYMRSEDTMREQVCLAEHNADLGQPVTSQGFATLQATALCCIHTTTHAARDPSGGA
jgi:hypothetical protein